MSTKNRILELLEKNRGESVSGEYIAGLLNVSRNAVWRAVTELRKDGYSIEAVTNRGYSLSDANDIVSVHGIKPYLSEKCLPFAEKIHTYKSVESTNKTAKEMAVAGAEHGTTVIADFQTAGRGRYYRSFFSAHGKGLYMSIILRPNELHFENTTAVTAFAAVAVCETIESVLNKYPTIKWVNDVLLDGKKVCGILTEAVTDFESGGLEWIVIGIGINVNIRSSEFPKELRQIAGSVCTDEQPFAVRNRLAAEIINRVIGANAQINEKRIFEEYKKRLILPSDEITVIQGDAEFLATAMDIDSLGHLIVKNKNGDIITLSSGEIQIRK